MTLEKYNSYFCLISIETFVLRFIENLKRKINKGTLNLKPFVSAGERIKAKHLWVKFIQNDIKSNNYKQLENQGILKNFRFYCHWETALQIQL